MSEIKVNKISPRAPCGTVTLGDSGDIIQVGTGVTPVGFGSTGEVSWNTTKITADPANAVSGVGYFCDTNGGSFTVTLPTAPSAGAVVGISDYDGSFGSNNLTVGRNSQNIQGEAQDFVIAQNNVSVQFIYVDATEGWRIVFTGTQSGLQETFISATGGSITCSGDYKIHTFTSPGTFSVTTAACSTANNEVSYLVVGAGGGAGGYLGAGGAGGFREVKSPSGGCYTASPLCGYATPANIITVSAGNYPITINGGGAGQSGCVNNQGVNGGTSVFSTITAAGGGGGAGNTPTTRGGLPGASGGGGSRTPGCATDNPIASGNTPPTTPPQGQNGSIGYSDNLTFTTGGGGGGATAAGTAGNTSTGGPGGAGATTEISGSPVAYAGGGGGSTDNTPLPKGSGTGGIGGGGNGGPSAGAGCNGAANTGGGGGGAKASGPAGSGGSGIIIIRYKYK